MNKSPMVKYSDEIADAKAKRAMEIMELRRFCNKNGLEWPSESDVAGVWGERMIAIVAALAAVMAGRG